MWNNLKEAAYQVAVASGFDPKGREVIAMD
jgi:hypothetical protein